MFGLSSLLFFFRVFSSLSHYSYVPLHFTFFSSFFSSNNPYTLLHYPITLPYYVFIITLFYLLFVVSIPTRYYITLTYYPITLLFLRSFFSSFFFSSQCPYTLLPFTLFISLFFSCLSSPCHYRYILFFPFSFLLSLHHHLLFSLPLSSYLSLPSLSS